MELTTKKGLPVGIVHGRKGETQMILPIGERIVMYRVAHGLTQAEFAKRCGVSYSTISHIETESDRPLSRMTKRKIEYVLMGGTIRKEQ